ncbi:hypothetical protein IT415_01855 [bacterium]|nr:hypothetical protein [bacterium]
MTLIEHIDSAPWFDSKLAGPNIVFTSIIPPYLPHFVENTVCQHTMLNDAATGLVKAVGQEFEFVPETAMSI